MRDDLALCPHLAALAPGPAPFTLAADEIFAFSDGPALAVVRCAACGACGWLESVAADPRRGLRVFVLAAIREADVALYLRDVARGSCDVGRARAELEALAASAGPGERLLALDTGELRLVAVAPLEPGVTPSAGDAFARLGLSRSGA